MYSDKTLLEQNVRGLIHAPDESDDAFVIRCKNAKKRDSTYHSSLAKKLFDIEPDWVHLCFSDHRLRLWEGGCTWINSDEVTVQLRKVFQWKAHYFGYSKEEILAHELVHVVRSGFEEPVFEEILAYQTSRSRLRRLLGPIFRSSSESIIFIVLLLVSGLSTLLAAFQIPVYLGTLTVFSGGIFRLFRAQRIFFKARKQIAHVVGKRRALAVLLRLTDREITRFAKMKKDEIISYGVKMSRTQLRWRQIRLTYFPI